MALGYPSPVPYDEKLASRMRAALSGTPGLSEKKMFGGIGFMVGGNMACGVMADGRMLLRCADEDHGRFTKEAGAAAMERGGKAMKGWVLVDAAALAPDAAFRTWVARGRDFAASLPAK
jgi:TfoX/Sxy family transcriptional regulator of competence genes